MVSIHTEAEIPFFLSAMVRILGNDTSRIEKCVLCPMERNAVLALIHSKFASSMSEG